MSRRPFDSFEVQLVASYADESTHADSHYMETINTLEEFVNEDRERHAVFYTTYGYRDWGEDNLAPDGGAVAIADFDQMEDAVDLAIALADGKPFVNLVPDGLEHVNTKQRIS